MNLSAAVQVDAPHRLISGYRTVMSIRPGDQEMAWPRRRRLRVARLVGELLSPPPILAVLALVVAWDSSTTAAMAILWGGIAAVSASVLPYALILRGVRRGRLSDRNISLREQRIRFGGVAITSILVGLAVLVVFDAPAEMVALQASIAVGVACGWVITLWWKISVHAAIAAGAATVLVLVFGPALLAVWPLVAVIAWSRVQVGDHSGAGPRWRCPGSCRERHDLSAAAELRDLCALD
jgi:hypothetical protein